MTEAEIETLVNYLSSLGPGDMRDGAYELNLTGAEIDFILERINIG